MQNTPIKLRPFCERPFMNPAFCGSSAHIGLFELPRTSVSGHHGRTEEDLVSVMSARPLTALSHVSLGKATTLYFQESFPLFFVRSNQKKLEKLATSKV
jgi:hypothetical protein